MTNLDTVKHGGTSVYSGMEDRFDDMKSELKDIKEMREQVKNNPNLSPSEKESMLKNLDQAETAIKQGLDYATNSSKYDTTAGNIKNDGDHAAIEAAMARAETSLSSVQQQLMIADRLGPSEVSKPPASHGSDGVSGATGADKSSAADGAAASGGTGIGAMEFGGKTVDEMTAMMDSDPNALMAHLDTLSAEESQMAMQMMMKSLQDMNQMFSMMSNMMKSQHDTAKAAINNMRV